MQNQIVVSNANNTNAIINFIAQNVENIVNSQPCKETTKRTYLSYANEFSAWLHGKDFSIDTVMMYRSELEKNKQITTNTKNIKLASVRMVLKELYFRGIIPIDVTPKVKNFKQSDKQHRDGINRDELSEVKEYILALHDTKKRNRLFCMFALMSLQGLRQFEVCNIEITDFNEKDATLKICGKGYSEKQSIDLHPTTVQALKAHVGTSKSGFLFTSEKGTTKGERLSERGFRKIWETIFDGLGIDRTAHGFRHFFVTTMLEATNGNIGIVQQFSRHKSVQAVMMYDDRRMKKEHNKLFYKAFDI